MRAPPLRWPTSVSLLALWLTLFALGCSGRTMPPAQEDAGAEDAEHDQDDAAVSATEDAASAPPVCDASDPCELGWECGMAEDGCGETRACGSCARSEACRDHACIATCLGCVIDGQCYLRGESDRKTPCLVCDPAQSGSAFSPRASGTSCDDRDACTSGDQCSAGVCAGVAKRCDDGVACNGHERCEPSNGACRVGDNTCGSAICDVATDRCTTTCASGCLIAGVCHPAGAVALTSSCMVCDPVRSRSTWSAQAGKVCGEGDGACLLDSTCDAAGACAPRPAAAGQLCGPMPSDPCELPASCDSEGGCMPGTTWAPGSVCGDHAHCTPEGARVTCRCDAGFVKQDGSCVDIDECATNADDCDAAPDACVNQPGSFACQCPEAFSGDGRGPGGCSCARADYSPLCRPWSQISMQWQHACALSAGVLFCWGANDKGQLGIGDLVDRAMPARVGVATDWSAVSVGADHTCGLRAGQLYCWGNPIYGGHGFDGDGREPARVGSASDWTAVAAGSAATCGIRAGGALYCWGLNSNGRLGLGSTELLFSTPQRVTALDVVQAVSFRIGTVCALRAGELYCWGDNSTGNAGLGSVGGSADTPTRLTAFNDWSAVEVGCAVRASGALYCWGGIHNVTAPTLQPARSDWSEARAGHCGLTRAGDAYCWGANTNGQAGLGTATPKIETPTPLPARGQWTALAATFDTVCGIRDGGLSCWGSNERGLRGTGFALGRVGAASDYRRVTSGFAQSCAIKATGELVCWGSPVGVNGVASYQPQQVGSDDDWREISAGAVHLCGLRAGALFCWGFGARAQLGDGSKTDLTAPTPIGSDHDWEHISAGDFHTCGVRAGALYCWGANESGQLGDGSTTERVTPTLVAGSGWSSVRAGRDHTCGMRAGALYCWGNRGFGMLGDGASSGTQTTPIRVGTEVAWSAVAVGDSYTCAVQAGTLYCWGGNTYGQLGNGGAAGPTQLVPTPVAVAQGWSAVTTNASSTCALTTAGALYCWGLNSQGELGSSDTTNRTLPTQVGGALDWQQLAQGWSRTCAIRAGALYCWGDNTNGALGHADGFAPVPVANTNAQR